MSRISLIPVFTYRQWFGLQTLDEINPAHSVNPENSDSDNLPVSPQQVWIRSLRLCVRQSCDTSKNPRPSVR